MYDQLPYDLIGFSLAAALVPLLIASMTCFAKIGIIMGVIKNAFGVQGVPGKMAELALSCSLTLYIMSPVMIATCNQFAKAKEPVLSQDGLSIAALSAALEPWFSFLDRHVGMRERAFIESISTEEKMDSEQLKALFERAKLVPAFVLSELRSGFVMGFAILIPFLIVDFVVANILVGLGLSMVSPTVISFPLKLLLFVAGEGWMMITKGLLLSYGVG